MTTDPRFDQPSFFVECKNWVDPVGQQVVSALDGKLMSHRLSQGFLMTTGTLSADARQQALNLYMSSKVAIVLLDGADMEKFLSEARPVSDLLVEQYRQVLLRGPVAPT
jgi:restriction endonuclease Mrr